MGDSVWLVILTLFKALLSFVWCMYIRITQMCT